MNFTDEQKWTRANVVGVIKEIDLVDDVMSNGNPYRRGTLTVSAGEEEFVIRVFQSKYWKYNTDKQKDNPNYAKLGELRQNETATLLCSLEENRFFVNNQIISNNQISLSFIGQPRQTDVPGLTFEFAGVVVEPIKEVYNENAELDSYSLKISQAQYNIEEKGPSTVVFTVDKNNTQAITFMRSNYTVGKTVKVSGHGKGEVITKKTVEEAQFGQPTEKITHRLITKFVITSGLNIPESINYTQEQIDFMVRTGLDRDAALMSPKETKSSGGTGFEDNNSPITNNPMDLFGL